MNRVFGLGVMLILSGIMTPVWGQAYKCIQQSGRILYQAQPCPADTQGGELSLNVNQPVAGVVPAPDFDSSTPIMTPPSAQPTADAAVSQPPFVTLSPGDDAADPAPQSRPLLR